MYKVVFYARVSTQEEQQIDALKNQIQMLEEFINSIPNWNLVDKYVDEGKSGTTTKGRADYNRLYNDLVTDKFDIIVVKDLSRLQRNPLNYYQFINCLIQNKKKLYIYVDRKFYESDDALVNGIKAILAGEYSRDISKKVNAGQRQRQKKGTVITNGNMWGYNQERGTGKLTVNEEEAKVVRQIFEWYCEEKGFRKIQQLLEEKGIKNHNGNSFSLTTLKRIIKNEKYMGKLVCNKRHKDFDTKQIYNLSKDKWIVHEDAVPAIVSKEVWKKANDILNRKKKVYDIGNKKIIAGHFAGNYLYSGKIFCGKCGRPYWHQKYKTMANDLWQCSGYRIFGKSSKNGCDNNHIFTYVLDKIVKDVVFDFWKNKNESIKKTIDVLNQTLKDNNYVNDINKLTKQKIKLDKKRNNLIDMLSENLISKDEYVVKKNEVDAQLKNVNEDIYIYEEKNKNIINKKQRMEKIQEVIQEQSIDKNVLDDEIIKCFLKKIVININNEIAIYLNGDFEYIARKIDGDNYVYAEVVNSR